MKRTAPCLLILAFLAAGAAWGKPPAAPKPPPAASPVPSPAATVASGPPGSPVPWLRWMLEQDASPSAVPIPWADLVQTASGRQVVPCKPADPADAAFLAKIASALDGALPRLNRPDGPVRQARRLRVVPGLVEDEVQSALTGLAGVACEAAAASDPATLGDNSAESYPAFRLTEQASHRVYYLGVAFCPTGQRASPRPVLDADPKALAARMTTDGACLLIVLEHNAKASPDLAFLNWELIDLGGARVRTQTIFRAAAGEILLPAAALVDGRRGRD